MRIGLSYRKRHYRIRIAIVAVIILLLIFSILKRLEPAFYTQLSCHANTIVTDRVNKAVYNAFENYDGFSRIKESSEGKVASMSADTTEMNQIKAAAVINVQDELNAIKDGYIHIPLMSVVDFPVLNGMGMSIPVKVVPMTLVDAEYDESFISTGINQTRHKFDMIIKVQVIYSGFLLHKKETIVTQVPLINSVINGDVPQYYGNLAGTDAAIN